MYKDQVDELYHLLRLASNMAAVPRYNNATAKLIHLFKEPTSTTDEYAVNSKTGLTRDEEIGIFCGLSRHLLAGGDYSALIKYSQYYGTRFLIEPAYKHIVSHLYRRSEIHKPKRIVELGAGLGWLGRGLAGKFGLLPTLFIDKRPWTFINIVADLETEKGKSLVLSSLQEDDLIVMSDFLHCVDADSLDDILIMLAPWNKAILEYYPRNNPEWMDSYIEQITRYGADIFIPDSIEMIFRGVNIIDISPYILMLVEKEDE